MGEVENKIDLRYPHKFSTDINSSCLSQSHSPYKPFVNLMPTYQVSTPPIHRNDDGLH